MRRLVLLSGLLLLVGCGDPMLKVSVTFSRLNEEGRREDLRCSDYYLLEETDEGTIQSDELVKRELEVRYFGSDWQPVEDPAEQERLLDAFRPRRTTWRVVRPEGETFLTVIQRPGYPPSGIVEEDGRERHVRGEELDSLRALFEVEGELDEEE